MAALRAITDYEQPSRYLSSDQIEGSYYIIHPLDAAAIGNMADNPLTIRCVELSQLGVMIRLESAKIDKIGDHMDIFGECEVFLGVISQGVGDGGDLAGRARG